MGCEVNMINLVIQDIEKIDMILDELNSLNSLMMTSDDTLRYSLIPGEELIPIVKNLLYIRYRLEGAKKAYYKSSKDKNNTHIPHTGDTHG